MINTDMCSTTVIRCGEDERVRILCVSADIEIRKTKITIWMGIYFKKTNINVNIVKGSTS